MGGRVAVWDVLPGLLPRVPSRVPAAFAPVIIALHAFGGGELGLPGVGWCLSGSM